MNVTFAFFLISRVRRLLEMREQFIWLFHCKCLRLHIKFTCNPPHIFISSFLCRPRRLRHDDDEDTEADAVVESRSVLSVCILRARRVSLRCMHCEHVSSIILR